MTPEGESKFKIKPGTAYVVATPIGNLEDITLRALEVLKQSDIIYCENSQHSRRLFQTYGIQTAARTLYKDHSPQPFAAIIQELKNGGTLALVSDAGTPGVSDPGSQLVRILREENVPVVPVPGASALTSMLSVSGWQTHPSVFLGFLSEKKGKKRNQLKEWEEFQGPITVFESVHRIKDTLSAVREIFPEAPILLGRELTKIHEEILKISPDTPLESLKFAEKGEFVVLFYANPKKMLNGRVGDTDTLE
ncbi:16S rRNA (cytidine(1402)-2'-O)-methyltransferase [Leptospira wolffii]|uniref:Ribosomal RNA small subunit methyltransferase I n=1 Tax=Leptospira wolffii TaxID=409998 RepID=A0A2M9ZCS4_9LEPT|nr:16S rRNA (cytidine(1402)-2'-O)-methyltransferase [Leptospira wolffii]PJZ66226.1 16S rRNA (cytidine(1402)-2'-O)-methyltransferase [Leptospira wolffii]TGK60221.1 16S rRNA (cytidine(1402)-2'-O)-methyltransferase [Leptospira wolffii]TGK72563.1 16S rRNA (cytidine(1402)-2'-O)-methyltransferase [Leptospira wolffii]TGK76228.1 16S rRNA (cytidine(1402)-2'-O)-methyltransferase [Leptospira wolffii]TGL30480.1 16S rRNA (cytidine(1402)-2'-O)-methyltransferase [Leptospira wolffii]